MGTAYSARQSSYTQGDTIDADDSNDEFDAILAAFGTSGHSHDCTAGEGGAIAKLLSNTLTFGAATSGTDITITFDGESNDGVLAWMEDEDYFKFSDDVLINSTEKIMFGDTASFIHQSSDGVLTIDGEATIDLNASTAVLVSNDLKLNSDAAVLGFGADNDVTLTHVADTGLRIDDNDKMLFGDGNDFEIYHDGSNTRLHDTGTGNLLIQSNGSGVYIQKDASESMARFLTDGAVTLYHDNSEKLETSSTGVNVTGDVVATDDLYLDSDAAVIHFGDDGDVTLTHVADTGLLLNSTMAIQFNDASQYINAPSATVLDINATDEVEVNATLMDVNANLDVSGTYSGGGLMTTGGNIVIPDAGNIGSASDTDAIAISSGGVVTMNQIPVFSAGINVSGGTIAGTLSTAAQGNITSLGTLTTLTVDNIIINGTTIGHTSDTDAMTISSGGVVTFSQTPVFSGDLTIGDDVYLDSDAAVIHFGDDGDVTLTHVADTGLLLNSTRQLQFGDSGTYIHQSADGVLDLVSDTEIEINATTIDINGAVDVSGAYTGGGLMTTGGNIVIPNAGNIGSASDTDAIAISSGGVVTMNQIPVFSAGINVSGGTIAGTLATAAQGNVTSLGTLTTLTVDNIIINGTTIGHTSDTDALTISSGGVVTFSQTPVFSSDLTLGDDLYLDSDAAVIHFGDDGDVTLTHVADTGIRLADSDKMLFGDGNDLQIYHSGSHSFIDDAGTGDLFIRGDNSVYLSNAAGTETKASFTSDGAVNLYYNNTAVAMTNGTSWSPSSADGSSLGNSSLEWSDLFLADSATIQFGNDQDVILTHVPDSGLRLFDGVKFMFGDANDLQIYHVDGGNSWIRDTATDGNFIIEAVNGIDFRDYNTGELMTRMTGDGAVELYHNNIKKIETASNGVSLTEASSIDLSTPLLASADHTCTGLTAQMLAGGAISAFDLVCVHTTTSEVVEADASAYATARVIGIAPAAISDTATGTILLQGFIRDDSWNWTPGSTLYLSETAGAMTHTAPSTDGAFVNVVGVALSPDVVYINPSMDVIERA